MSRCDPYLFNRDLHGALLDAEILTQVYLAMTGGQGSLFSEEADLQTQTKRRTMKKINKDDYAPTVVIKADDDELKSHEAFMQFLEEQTNSK